MGESQKCVVDELFGFQHPYSFCVKPSDKMVNTGSFDRGGLLLNNTAKVLGGMFNYVDYLVTNPDVGTAEQCKYNGRGVIGNKYVLKTNIECTPVDNTGKIITTPGSTPYLHRYINNISTGASFLTGGQANKDTTGLIPSTFSSTTKIGENIYDLITSFTGRTKPYCMKASVNCHIIDYNMKGVRGPRNYSGTSPEVYFAIDQLKDLTPDDFPNGAITVPTVTEPPPPPSSTPPSSTPPSSTPPSSTPPSSTPPSSTPPSSTPPSSTPPSSSPPSSTPPTPTPTPGYSESTNYDYDVYPGSETFNNMDSTFMSVTDNIIKQNMDKIQNLSDLDKVLNSINLDHVINSVKFEDELLVKIYYVGFSILLILIILKLVFKKK